MAKAQQPPAKPPESKNRNLFLRIATAVVLLPIVLGLIWMGGLPFAALIGVAALLCAVELCAMALGDDPLRLPAALGAFAMPFFFIVPGLGEESLHWLYALVVVVILTWRLLRNAPVESAGRDVSYATFGMLYASLIGYLMPLRGLGEVESWSGGGWVVLACALTWLGDTGAYTAGRLFGKNKMYPRISPAKTWEGFAGGMLSSIGGAFALRATLLPALTGGDAIVLGILGGIGGPIGDLVESMLKRSFGVKDSGDILPGHGGMLDRVDALMINAPIVYFYAKNIVLARGGE